MSTSRMSEILNSSLDLLDLLEDKAESTVLIRHQAIKRDRTELERLIYPALAACTTQGQNIDELIKAQIDKLIFSKRKEYELQDD